MNHLLLQGGSDQYFPNDHTGNYGPNGIGGQNGSTNIYDTVERIVSIPILGTAFIAIRRKFERIK